MVVMVKGQPIPQPAIVMTAGGLAISKQLLDGAPKLYLRDLLPTLRPAPFGVTYCNLDALLPPNPNKVREERQRKQRARQQVWIDQHCLCREAPVFSYGEHDGDERVDDECCPIHGRRERSRWEDD